MTVTTKNDILKAAIRVVRKGGMGAIRTRAVADEANVDHASIFYHFETLDHLRACVITKAIKDNDKRIIARLILDKHACIKHLTADQRAAYLAALV
jgi:DNA-binding transcriptional regulator YbjK